MSGWKKSPLKVAKPSSAESWTNPFDSDDEGKDSKKYSSSRKTSSERALATLEVNTNPFDDDIDANKKSSSTSYAFQSANRNRYKNDFRDSGGLENQSVQELESYAVYKAEETTNSVNNCLKIAENIREDATKTLVTLEQQGEQITRSHHVAADIDHDLSRVSILLINTLFLCSYLGGFFMLFYLCENIMLFQNIVILSWNPFEFKSVFCSKTD